MKAILWTLAALGLTFVLPVATDAAVGDPEVIIYRFPGVRDDGSAANVGIATVFHCTNFSGVSETMRFVTRSPGGALLANGTTTMNNVETLTVATHSTSAYAGFTSTTGAVNAGTTAIAATSTNIVCTAMTIDAANAKPSGVPLHGIRLNPAPSSEE